jgi:hypothetical protein
MPNPFFSIVVPVYNHERYIAAALDSLLLQSDEDWEAIVVNDGSMDSTPAIIESYAHRDSRIRVFHKPNGGTASALNHAIRQTRGSWVCWLSSDDLFLPDKLAVHREWIQRHPECGYFLTDFMTLNDATGEKGAPYTTFVPDTRWMALDLLAVNYVNGISICVRRGLFDQCGLFDGAAGYGQDYDLHLRMLSTVAGVRIPAVTCLSRSHPGQGGRAGGARMMIDCGLTAVRFLNRVPLRRMLPRVKPGDEQQACAVMERTVEIAVSVNSYVYQAGAHPGLIMRLMEWVWGCELKTAAKHRLRMAFGRRARAAAYACRHTPLGVPWRMAAILSEMMPEEVAYHAVDPADVVDGAYSVARGVNAPMATAIADYARRFQSREIDRLPPCEPTTPQLSVLMAGEGRIANDRATSLAACGCSVLRIRNGTPDWDWTKGLCSLFMPSTARILRAVTSVVPLDVALVETGHSFPDIACAAESLLVTGGESGVAFDFQSRTSPGRLLRMKRGCAVLAGRCERKMRAWSI